MQAAAIANESRARGDTGAPKPFVTLSMDWTQLFFSAVKMPLLFTRSFLFRHQIDTLMR
jgi:hypothetical protein